MVRSAPLARVSNHEAPMPRILRDAAKPPLLRMRARCHPMRGIASYRFATPLAGALAGACGFFSGLALSTA